MRRGFTLIELLVVMAIISILASILFPVFSRAIDKAKATQCLSNVKQIQLATMMYAQDYDQWYPPGPYTYVDPDDGSTKTTIWLDTLQPYIENYQIMICPGLPPQTEPGVSGKLTGYAINYWMILNGGATAHKSSDKITYADASVISNHVSWYMYNYGGTDPDPDSDPATVGSTPDTRHMEGANFAFADGHAKWFRRDMPGVADFATAWDPQQ